ncbi:hypothetical protein [Polyangium aurulentum]|uniref:hypothetical protein n=1 Tax=Polyangium aurulentum TaxID=2567896 RepID=UPI0010ADFE62|nr:hypothetical protein [Polyangium aurulentum]UQA62150.1 hypothetical protein E8A73_017450 [Polyangium aurulentum]
MHALRALTVLSLVLVAPVYVGCGDDEPQQEEKGCSVTAQTGCQAGQICEEVEGAEPACFAPVAFKGKVINALDNAAVAGARVVARDANDAAVSSVAITAADGTYTLNVPAKRDSAGKPLPAKLTLRADASGFQTFPFAPRVALPIDVDKATGTPPVVQNASTDVALIPLQNPMGLGSIAGRVVVDGELDLVPAGALVVAGGSTGVVDYSGNFVVFNVATGSGINVNAYGKGLQIEGKTVAVEAGKETANVELHVTAEALARVTGKLSIVNGNGNSSTSVVLVLKETFIESAARGEVPKGLRVGNVSGDFAFEGVPAGDYKVLAAFENDGLVRDPDISIGGTAIVDVAVGTGDVTLAEGFKVTGAIDVLSPGAANIEEVMGKPTFKWADDSSEDHYEVRLFDAYGEKVWENLMVPGVSGSADVTAEYGGDALTPGMVYQFRATSIGKDGVPIAQTEDLKGVFIAR